MKTLLLKGLLTGVIAGLFSPTTLANTVIVPESMVVITSLEKPLQNRQYARAQLQAKQGTFTVYQLNAVDQFETRMSQGLPSNDIKAKQLFQQRLAKIGQETFKKQLIAAYQGLLTATRYHLDRYPAIVFDKQFVIYGVTDLRQALNHYNEWKKQQAHITSDRGLVR